MGKGSRRYSSVGIFARYQRMLLCCYISLPSMCIE
uniref:Uncharacterized protein n=1 Tax=Rhizophora mucronata TaxID=61149 RepID=A0A2P2PIF6_RHIMU